MKFSYFAADIEGSHGKGESPPVLSVLSVGLVLIGNPDEHFYAELKPISEHWDPAAEKIHGMSREYLRRNGEDPVRVLTAIDYWVRAHARGTAPVFCAMPLTYDWVHLDWYFRHFGINNPFLQTQDGRALYRQLRGLRTDAEVKRDRIWAEFPTVIPHIHHALSDALEYEEVHGGMLREAGLL